MRCREIRDPEFKPIKIELTFETEAELNNFWHRMYVSDEIIAKNTDKDSIFMVSDDATDLFLYIDNIYTPEKREE